MRQSFQKPLNIPPLIENRKSKIENSTVAMPKTPRVNLRTPEVMAAVQAQVESHYRSEVVEKLRAAGGTLAAGSVTVKLAKQFGFCYGVERAIDLAYAAAKVFTDRRLFILGEIIHNPEVNEQIRSLGIKNLIGQGAEAHVDDLDASDVVIVPAFGTDVTTLARIKEIGSNIVDTTCGDVMSVWKRVRQNAQDDMTSVIHGKASHEETKATASRAMSNDKGHYLVVLTLEDTDYVCDYIRHGGNKEAFLEKFHGAYSSGFDPDIHLKRVGVANQTTMMRGETEEVQRRIMAAIRERDGDTERTARNYRFFDTICGATQERQDALREMLDQPMDLLIVVGGYNSSNTSHLAEMGEQKLPTYFIRNASRLESRDRITHYDLHQKKEITTESWLPRRPVTIGITAGASCPNNLIEDAILRLYELHGIDRSQLLS
jgi:4-hydroxy-3-methylbut-2-enyl diphosphate reductase